MELTPASGPDQRWEETIGSPHPLQCLYINRWMQWSVEWESRGLRGAVCFGLCIQCAICVCVRCYTGWGGPVRNAIIIKLSCCGLTSRPAFCLHLETKTKKASVLPPPPPPFPLITIPHGTEKKVNSQSGLLLLLWWECWGIISNPGRAVLSQNNVRSPTASHVKILSNIVALLWLQTSAQWIILEVNDLWDHKMLS